MSKPTTYISDTPVRPVQQPNIEEAITDACDKWALYLDYTAKEQLNEMGLLGMPLLKGLLKQTLNETLGVTSANATTEKTDG